MRRLREMKEAEDWRRRRGRFHLCDPDTPERRQIMPREAPPVNEQSHWTVSGERRAEGGSDDATA